MRGSELCPLGVFGVRRSALLGPERSVYPPAVPSCPILTANAPHSAAARELFAAPPRPRTAVPNGPDEGVRLGAHSYRQARRAGTRNAVPGGTHLHDDPSKEGKAVRTVGFCAVTAALVVIMLCTTEVPVASGPGSSSPSSLACSRSFASATVQRSCWPGDARAIGRGIEGIPGTQYSFFISQTPRVPWRSEKMSIVSPEYQSLALATMTTRAGTRWPSAPGSAAAGTTAKGKWR